jgi:hypothetical protein
VRYDNVPVVWTDVRDGVQESLDRGEGRILDVDIYEALLQRRMQLFIVYAGGKQIAVCVTEIANYPRTRVIRVVLVSGSQREVWIKKLQEELEAWGRKIGATYLEMQGREGWRRVLKDWRLKSVLMEKRIESEA